MKNFLFSVVFYFCCVQIFSQTINKLPTAAVWLKTDEANQQVSRDSIADFFNFNPILDISKAGILHDVGTWDKFSVLLAFRSESGTEVPLLSLRGKNTAVYFSNQKIMARDTVKIKRNPRNGLIMSYISSTGNKSRHGNAMLLPKPENMISEEGKHNDLLEILYFPKALDDNAKRRIETYLSIKYGISLSPGSDYLDTKGNKIWDAEKNAGFDHRVTGVGKDVATGLHQYISGNAEKDGLHIGFQGKKNSEKVTDGSYWIWGDNGAVASIPEEASVDGFKAMPRIWKMSVTENRFHVPGRLTLDKKIIKLPHTGDTQKQEGKTQVLWLAVSKGGDSSFDYQGATFYKTASEDAAQIVFDNIRWDEDNSGSDQFTFVMAPDYFITNEVVGNCNASDPAKVTVKLHGGVAPYEVYLNAGGNSQKKSGLEDEVVFGQVTGADYFISAKDASGKNASATLQQNDFSVIRATILPKWTLDTSGQVKIEISGTGADQAYSCLWFFGDKPISTSKDMAATEEGTYSVVVKNEEGCEKKMFFSVSKEDNLVHDGWAIYPNPVASGKTFHVDFNLKKPSDVSLSIFDFANRLIKHAELGKITSFTYPSSLAFPGSYLIMLTIDGKTETAKIIVN